MWRSKHQMSCAYGSSSAAQTSIPVCCRSHQAFHSRTKRFKPIIKQLMVKTSGEAKIKPLDSHSSGTIPVTAVKTPEPCTVDSTSVHQHQWSTHVTQFLCNNLCHNNKATERIPIHDGDEHAQRFPLLPPYKLTSGDGYCGAIISNIHAKRMATKLQEMQWSMSQEKFTSSENMWKVLSTGFLSVVSE